MVVAQARVNNHTQTSHGRFEPSPAASNGAGCGVNAGTSMKGNPWRKPQWIVDHGWNSTYMSCGESLLDVVLACLPSHALIILFRDEDILELHVS
jgi:hypothetical protein